MSSISVPTSLPTLYEHYTDGGIHSGLSADNQHFTLNEKNITLYSGAFHYFRVPKQHWRDRLRKMRAAGLNAVETYVPWNLHEPEKGVYDFGHGDSDMQDFLNIEEFLKIAHEEDLLTIVRPGPYICAEWEYGGLPSWLLAEKNITVRSSDAVFMKHVTRFFNALLPILTMLQFTKGGSIIGLQLENEFGYTRVGLKPTDKNYLQSLKDLMTQNGIVELLFTSDSPLLNADTGALPGILQTGNFKNMERLHLNKLRALQPDKALMVMEYWTGWYDHWSEEHHTTSADTFEKVLRNILNYPASVNLYMFVGSTNFGFLNGANINDGTTQTKNYQPTTTSYDYDSPITESGDYTNKYERVQKVIQEHNTVLTKLPTVPKLVSRVAYPEVMITEQLTLQEIQEQIKTKITSKELLPMEHLPINNNSGQSYGYIVYKKKNLNILPNSVLKISGRVSDTVIVLINGELKSPVLKNNSDLDGFGYWRLKDAELNLGAEEYMNATLELVVENFGRNNFGTLAQFKMLKGLWQGPVQINNKELEHWEIIPLEFKRKWNSKLTNWHDVKSTQTPALYKAKFTIVEARDTYIDMSEWTRGFVMINGFVLGRHAIIGPQMSLYLPAPLLNVGENEIVIFEHFSHATKIKFTTDPIWIV